MTRDAKPLFIVDGSGLLYRSYYGLRPLHTPEGVPVHAIFNFFRILKKLIDTHHPEHILIVWDSPGKTSRHHIFDEYKATRQAPPSDLFGQKKTICEILELIGIAQVAESGIEADDLICGAAQKFSEKCRILILTGDKDLRQIISPKISIFDPFKEELLDMEEIEKKYGFPVAHLPLYFGLVGDVSDNIPGVPGIGKKGATELARKFNSLDQLYENLESISSARSKKALQENKKAAYLSLRLVTLESVCPQISFDETKFEETWWARAYPQFELLRFKTLLPKGYELQDSHSAIPLVTEQGYKFELITILESLQAVVREIEAEKYVAIDTELDGLNPLESRLVGISLCVKPGAAYYVPCGHVTGESQLSRDIIVNELKEVFARQEIKKVFHHANFDLRVLRSNGFEIDEIAFDTLIAAHLVTDEWQRNDLKSLSATYLHERMLTFNEVVKDGGYANFSEVPLARATSYAAADAHQTARLHQILLNLLHEKEVMRLFETLELPLVSLLVELEMTGIKIDVKKLEQMNERVTQELQRIRNNLIDLVGDDWKSANLNSPKQIAQLLFEHLKLSPVKKSGKGTAHSTDTEVLSILAKQHPVPLLLLNYRELNKLKNTYLDALPLAVNKKTGRVHTTFSQTAVATGRLASSDPNLQNIPTGEGGTYAIEIRSAFVPAPGSIFISADYSQIELRVLAYLSQDKRLLEAFSAGRDIHTETAALLYEKSQQEVTQAERQIGKRINFSILYGLTPYGLSKDLEIPLGDAKRYIEKYFAQYAGVLNWMERTIEFAKQHGYVKTLEGRRRYLPAIHEKNKNLFEAARRAAINTVAQGTAAEIMKRGMLNLEEKLKSFTGTARMLLQIHDELLLEVDQKKLEECSFVVKATLEGVAEWNVPLIVSVRSGNNWQEITK